MIADKNSIIIKSHNDCIIAFDNGTTGGVAIDSNNTIFYYLARSYIKKEQSYTKIKQNISRIDYNKLKPIIEKAVQGSKNPIAVLERPMINPTRFKASVSASRCLEATLIVLEQFNIPVMYCDSKEWQHYLFGKKVIGDTKIHSSELGNKLFPQFSKLIDKQDADALLILEWYKKVYNNV